MIIPYLVIIPLAAGFLIVLLGRKNKVLPELIALTATFSLLAISLLLFPMIESEGGAILYELSGWKIPYTISFVIDYLSAFLVTMVSALAVLSTIYSVGYMRRFSGIWNYYALLMLMITGLNGVAITGDLFNLFVFMEIALIATYALVAFHGEAEHYEAAFKYAIMSSLSSSLVLFGIGCVYSMTSSLTLMQISNKMIGVGETNLVYALFLTGFGLKAAMFPFHSWLPDAHPSAPSPVSAMLSGVLIKVLGAYTLIRVFYMVFGVSELVKELFLIFGTLSMVIGALVAVMQKDIKRMLGFSSVSQMGYIIFALGIGTPLGVLGAIYHMLNHAVLKGLLFMDAGAVELIEGTRDMEEMKGVSDRTTYVTSLMASLGISGVPPFGGFFSKLIIITAAIYTGKFIYAIIALAVSVITLGYYLGMLKKAFRKRNKEVNDKGSLPASLKIPMIILAVLTLATALFYVPVVRENILEKVVSCITDRTAYIALFTAGGGR